MPYPPKNLRLERYLDNIFRYSYMDYVKLKSIYLHKNKFHDILKYKSYVMQQTSLKTESDMMFIFNMALNNP